MFQDVSLNQVPILELLALDLFLLSTFLDLLTFLLELELLDLGKRDAELVLLAEHVQQVCLLLLHLELETADFLLLLLHFET